MQKTAFRTGAERRFEAGICNFTRRGGALARKIAAQQQALTGLQAHLTAWVDFPEEDVPALEDGPLRASLEEVKAALDELIGGYNAAAVLREGIDCAIVGRPNAGKSTLLNLLAGFDRAIVTPIAGTTRDVVEQAVQLGTSSTPPACARPTTRWRPRASAAAGPSWPRRGWCWPSLTAPGR